jgi:hypothetical protein
VTPGRSDHDFEVEPAVAREQVAGPLADLFFEHRGNLIHKWVHYLAAYEEEFARYRSQPNLRMLEIGVFQGGSLQLWRSYFGPSASVWGIDIDPRCADLGDDNVRIGSQDDPAFLHSVVEEMGGLDLVLDDGSHQASHQRKTLEALFPLLSEGGCYAVEDLHTSYWAPYEGGYQREGTFIETVKQIVDDMHTWYHETDEVVGVRARDTIPRIAVYDSIAFVRKQTRARPVVTRVGTPIFDS